MNQQPGPDLLVHQLGQARAQDLPRPAQMGLELVVPGFLLSGKASGLPRWPPLSTARAAFTASQRKQAAMAARFAGWCVCVGE